MAAWWFIVSSTPPVAAVGAANGTSNPLSSPTKQHIPECHVDVEAGWEAGFRGVFHWTGPGGRLPSAAAVWTVSPPACGAHGRPRLCCKEAQKE
ncbi:unnamed protein product [Merluccius merluccius]